MPIKQSTIFLHEAQHPAGPCLPRSRCARPSPRHQRTGRPGGGAVDSPAEPSFAVGRGHPRSRSLSQNGLRETPASTPVWDGFLLTSYVNEKPLTARARLGIRGSPPAASHPGPGLVGEHRTFLLVGSVPPSFDHTRSMRRFWKHYFPFPCPASHHRCRNATHFVYFTPRTLKKPRSGRVMCRFGSAANWKETKPQKPLEDAAPGSLAAGPHVGVVGANAPHSLRPEPSNCARREPGHAECPRVCTRTGVSLAPGRQALRAPGRQALRAPGGREASAMQPGLPARAGPAPLQEGPGVVPRTPRQVPIRTRRPHK